ncbi:MAG: TetR family transcriptional regulator [Clostridia bacterium]|nr:TetR family transcriptional regulator [Clostridia bacterium]
MNTNDHDTRNRIIETTITLLDEVDDVDKITVRQIAERANIGVGLINYHFRSKDNLLSIAVGEVMSKIATDFAASPDYSDLKPEQKLKTMLKELYHSGERHEKLLQFILTHEILNGDMKAPLFLVPILRELFAGEKDDMTLRIIALQILLPIQVASINPDRFHLYSGVDLYSEVQRNSFIDLLIDHTLK